MGEKRKLSTVTAEPQRLTELYQQVLAVLDDFEHGRTIYRAVEFGPVRLALLRQAASTISIEVLTVDERCAGLGLASCTLAALTDFADVLGWTLTARLRPLRDDVDAARLLGLFGQRGFRVDIGPHRDGTQVHRLPAPL